VKNIFTYCLLFTSLLFVGCKGCNEKKLPSLKETYQNNDKKPFGGFIAFEELSLILNQEAINISTIPLGAQWKDIKDEYDSAKLLYILITKNLMLNYLEVNTILKFVSAGNDLFISADYIQPELLEGFHCRVRREKEALMESGGKMQTASVMKVPNRDNPLAYSYYYYPFFNSILFEKKYGTVLGFNQNNESNYVVLEHGKGKVYLHVAPRVFSNYFLLSHNNLDYYKYVLSTIDSGPDYIFWDEYYKLPPEKRRQQKNGSADFSALRVFKKNPALMWALGLVIAGLLLYVAFNTKRKQRSIREIPPKSNATVAFTEIIGRLYLQQKNNKNIAEKQITYFYEKIRNQYFIQTSEPDDLFLQSLAGKSGVGIELIKELFTLIKHIQKAEEISEEELMELNDKITTFNKNKK
jgi:hypothetical protein